MAIIIAFSNHKGGVGKTTSAVNIGAGLSNRGKKVLMIDLDPQANLSQSLGVKNSETSIYEVMKGEIKPNPIVVTENLHLIPSSLELSSAEMEFINEAGREFILSEVISPLKDRYDLILIDCPPSLGLLTTNALTAADQVYIPIQSHYLAIKGLAKISEVIDKIRKRLNKGLTIGGVIITQFDKRKVLHRDVADTIQTYFQDKVFHTKIRDNISLAEAPSSGQDIFRYSPKSFGAEDYEAICNEIIEKLSA